MFPEELEPQQAQGSANHWRKNLLECGIEVRGERFHVNVPPTVWCRLRYHTTSGERDEDPWQACGSRSKDWRVEDLKIVSHGSMASHIANTAPQPRHPSVSEKAACGGARAAANRSSLPTSGGSYALVDSIKVEL